MSKETCDFEVTEVLRQKGIRKIEKQRETIAITLSDNTKIIRSTIYKTDFDKSIRAFKKACSPHIDDNLIIQEIIVVSLDILIIFVKYLPCRDKAVLN
jgi:hypothetical protein